MRRQTQAITARLADQDAELVRRNHEQRLAELQRMPAASMVVVQGVALPAGSPGAAIPVAHGLGRAPRWVCPSAVRGAATVGVIVDLGSVDLGGNPIDRSKVVMLVGSGFGSAITVDVAFL
jgi:hypothetical protein